MPFQISMQIKHLLAHKPFMTTSSEILQVLSQILFCCVKITYVRAFYNIQQAPTVKAFSYSFHVPKQMILKGL